MIEIDYFDNCKISFFYWFVNSKKNNTPPS